MFTQFVCNIFCAANSNIELATALKCQKQLLMLSISNLGGRESLEIAVMRGCITTFIR